MTEPDAREGQPSVTVVIPNLDGGPLLERCVRTVLAQEEGIVLDVVVVDNGSTDGSAKRVKEQLPAVVLIENPRNEGFARACNQGAALARGGFILFLNNDVRVTPNCIPELVLHAAADRAAAAWQPRLVRPVDRYEEPFYSLLTSTGFLVHQEAKRSEERTEDAFSLKGACLLVRRSAFERVGGFDDTFFAYFEESDLCWRFHLAGWSVRFVDICCAEHIGGATSTRIFSLHYLDYLSFRNRLTSVLKNAGPRTLLTMLPLHLAAVAAVAGAFLVQGEWRHVLAIVRAVAAAIWRLPGTLRARSSAQRLRTARDREFLPPLMVPVPRARLLDLLRRYTSVRAQEAVTIQSEIRR